MAGREDIMSKKISVHFWSLFNRYEDDQPASPGSRNEDKNRTKVKDLLEKISDTENKTVVYANDDMGARVEGREPDFQKEVVRACMEEKMKNSDIPFDEVVFNKPKDTDIDINYGVTEHKNWESVLLKKLKGDGD